MKNLLLIRHAKSSWEHPEKEDHDRPLNSRGLHDLPRMANRLKAFGHRVDVCWTSTAVRAKTTAEALAPMICDAPLISHDQLYTFDQLTLAEQIRSAEDHIDALAVVGHNPAMEELCQHLLGNENVERFPTCTLAWLQLDIDHWQDMYAGCAELIYFDWPKRLQD